MATLTPIREADLNIANAMRRQLIEDLMQMAGSAAGEAQDLVYRDLTATDFNAGTVTARLSNPNALVANVLAGNQWPTFKLLATQAAAIYAFGSLASNPQISQLTFVAGPSTLSINNLDVLYGDTDVVEGIFNPPIAWGPNEVVNIGLLAGAAVAANAEAFFFRGVIVGTPTDLGVVAPRTLVSRNGRHMAPGQI